ncbi:hypothetical protein [Oceanivirga salmonicida]|uniref:hypothetical protein n=1 Tax=Oceanivirga salmonicida TaxID=1769291 RepID=UPI00082DCFD3|nr:hypothetical protein [Oceanivirga salmonicida]
MLRLFNEKKINQTLKMLKNDESQMLSFLNHIPNYYKNDDLYNKWVYLLKKLRNKKPLEKDRFSKIRPLHNELIDINNEKKGA